MKSRKPQVENGESRTARFSGMTAGALSGLLLSAGIAVHAAPATVAADAQKPVFKAPLAPLSAPESYYVDGQKYTLPPSQGWIGVQVKPNTSSKLLAGIKSEAALDEKRQPLRVAGDHLLLLPVEGKASKASKSKLRSRLGRSNTVRSLVRLYGNAGRPFIDNGQFVVRFKSGVSPARAQAILKQNGATVVRSLGRLASGEYLARATDPMASSFGVSGRLYNNTSVSFSHPNFLMPMEERAVPDDTLYKQQWHLNNTGQGGGKVGADVRAQTAWDITKGSPDVTIAVLDDGFDIDHEDLSGAQKLVPGYDFLDDDADPRPMAFDDDHGTACAGVATAQGFNGIGVSGIAPNCKLMPVRMLAPFVTPLQQAESFYFASGRGRVPSKSADVISCSWGPTNAGTPLPDVVKQAINYATTSGRGGKGCVVLFAAGNSNRTSDSDGYASYERVISVSASTNLDDRAFYSNFGESVDVCAPSSGGTLGIVTTDRTGAPGYSDTSYTFDFGGTSSACPLVAGVAALLLSTEPNLTSNGVRERLQDSADKIDPAGGAYDANGHSKYYGAGRVNAARALAGRPAKVTLIAPADNTRVSGNVPLQARVDDPLNTVQQVSFDQRRQLARASRTPNRAIPDFVETGITESVVLTGEERPVTAELTVDVEIAHSYIGDLEVAIIEPNGRRTVIYDHTGGDAKVLSLSETLPAAPRSASGTYSLQVIDDVQEDSGTLISWGIKLATPFTPIATDSNKADNATNGNLYTATWETKSLASGIYDVRASALVPAANGNSTRTFTDINTNISVVGLASRLYKISGRVIDMERRPVSGVRLDLGEGKVAVSDAQGNFSFSDVASGTYVLRAIQVGSIFTPETITLNVNATDLSNITFVRSASDSEAPTVRITTPSSERRQSFVSLAAVTGTASDNRINGVRLVTVRLIRAAVGTTPAAFFNPATKRFDTVFDAAKHDIPARGTTTWGVALPALDAGVYAVQATATDRANNIGRSALVYFNIDRTAPTVSIVTPANNAVYTLGALKTATGSAKDNLSVVRVSGLLYRYATTKTAAVFYNGRQWVLSNPGELGEPTATFDGRNWSLPLPSLAQGRYYLRITAKDGAGNLGRATNVFSVSSSGVQNLQSDALASGVAGDESDDSN